MVNQISHIVKLLSSKYRHSQTSLRKWLRKGLWPEGQKDDPDYVALLAKILVSICRTQDEKIKIWAANKFAENFSTSDTMLVGWRQGEAAQAMRELLIPVLTELEEWAAGLENAAGRCLWFRLLNCQLVTCLPEGVERLSIAIRANRLPQAEAWRGIFGTVQYLGFMRDLLRQQFALEMPPADFFPWLALLDTENWHTDKPLVLDRAEALAGVRRLLDIPESTRQQWISEERLSWQRKLKSILGLLPRMTQPWAAALIDECLESSVFEIRHAMAAQLLSKDPRAVAIFREICPQMNIGSLAADNPSPGWRVYSTSLNCSPEMYEGYCQPEKACPPPVSKLVWEQEIRLPGTAADRHFRFYRVDSRIESRLESPKEILLVSEQGATSRYVLNCEPGTGNEPLLEDLLYAHIAGVSYDYLLFPVDPSVQYTLSLLPRHLELMKSWPGEPLDDAKIVFVLDCEQMNCHPFGAPAVLLLAEATLRGDVGFAILEGSTGEQPTVVRHFWQPKSCRPPGWGARLTALEHAGRVIAGCALAHLETRRQDGPWREPLADDEFLRLFQRHLDWAEQARLGELAPILANDPTEPIHRYWPKYVKLMKKLSRTDELSRVVRFLASVVKKGQEGFACLLAAELALMGDKEAANAVFQSAGCNAKAASGHQFATDYMPELALACLRLGMRPESMMLIRQRLGQIKRELDSLSPLDLADRYYYRQRYAATVASLAVMLDDNGEACSVQIREWELPESI